MSVIKSEGQFKKKLAKENWVITTWKVEENRHFSFGLLIREVQFNTSKNYFSMFKKSGYFGLRWK